MKILEVKELAIPEVKVIKFARFCDDRGYFTETYRKSDILSYEINKDLRLPTEFVQGNESFSHKNVFRGLHFQWNPYMGKLVRCVTGHIFDFALDIRKGSPNFGKVIGYELRAKAQYDYSEWIWVPPGFAHGILTMDKSLIEYLCTGEYSQGCEACIRMTNSGIDWSLFTIMQSLDSFGSLKKLVISEKDSNGLTLDEWLAKPESEEFVYGTI
jgi:dTDP-4-dehydrorhamnose 3,5-epimerase